MAKKKFHTFRGVRYEIRYSKRMKDEGLTQPPDTSRTPVMKISGKLGDIDRLETEIHEALHACQWDLDEEAVTEIAGDISLFLWNTGYRLGGPEELELNFGETF